MLVSCSVIPRHQLVSQFCCWCEVLFESFLTRKSWGEGVPHKLLYCRVPHKLPECLTSCQSASQTARVPYKLTECLTNRQSALQTARVPHKLPECLTSCQSIPHKLPECLTSCQGAPQAADIRRVFWCIGIGLCFSVSVYNKTGFRSESVWRAHKKLTFYSMYMNTTMNEYIYLRIS